MRRENTIAYRGFHTLVAGLWRCATDRFFAGMLAGGISAFVVGWLPTGEWLWAVGATLIVTWRIHHRVIRPRAARQESQDLHRNRALL